MLGRLVRIQLLLFTIASVIGISAMVIGYIQAPTLLGIGRITVTLELPAAGGLYRFSNVTYRGVEIGKVTDVRAIDGRRVDATLSLATSPRIPANLVAKVRSVSAVGEQYVDLQPPNDAPPFLHDGSVIVLGQTAIPEPVGPMLDRLDALVGTIPKDELGPPGTGRRGCARRAAPRTAPRRDCRRWPARRGRTPCGAARSRPRPTARGSRRTRPTRRPQA